MGSSVLGNLAGGAGTPIAKADRWNTVSAVIHLHVELPGGFSGRGLHAADVEHDVQPLTARAREIPDRSRRDVDRPVRRQLPSQRIGQRTAQRAIRRALIDGVGEDRRERCVAARCGELAEGEQRNAAGQVVTVGAGGPRSSPVPKTSSFAIVVARLRALSTHSWIDPM
ncbi:hypothetical protein [Burkholderia glumae]